MLNPTISILDFVVFNLVTMLFTINSKTVKEVRVKTLFYTAMWVIMMCIWKQL